MEIQAGLHRAALKLTLVDIQGGELNHLTARSTYRVTTETATPTSRQIPIVSRTNSPAQCTYHEISPIYQHNPTMPANRRSGVAKTSGPAARGGQSTLSFGSNVKV